MLLHLSFVYNCCYTRGHTYLLSCTLITHITPSRHSLKQHVITVLFFNVILSLCQSLGDEILHGWDLTITAICCITLHRYPMFMLSDFQFIHSPSVNHHVTLIHSCLYFSCHDFHCYILSMYIVTQLHLLLLRSSFNTVIHSLSLAVTHLIQYYQVVPVLPLPTLYLILRSALYYCYLP